MYWHRRELIGKAIIIIAVFVFVISFITIVAECRNNQDNFNNGYCIKCGTKYEAISHQGKTYYECPNCYFGCWH